MWIDSHCHLSAEDFADDHSALLDRAAAAGVEAFIAVGSGFGIARNGSSIALAAEDERVFATAGVHPHAAKELDDDRRAQLSRWLDDPRVVAVGECGLDYHYMNSSPQVQREVFAEQLAIARNRDLPVVIHVSGMNRMPTKR